MVLALTMIVEARVHGHPLHYESWDFIHSIAFIKGGSGAFGIFQFFVLVFNLGTDTYILTSLCWMRGPSTRWRDVTPCRVGTPAHKQMHGLFIFIKGNRIALEVILSLAKLSALLFVSHEEEEYSHEVLRLIVSQVPMLLFVVYELASLLALFRHFHHTWRASLDNIARGEANGGGEGFDRLGRWAERPLEMIVAPAGGQGREDGGGGGAGGERMDGGGAGGGADGAADDGALHDDVVDEGEEGEAEEKRDD